MSDTYTPARVRTALQSDTDALNALEDSGLMDANALNVLLRIKNHSPEGLQSRSALRIIERQTSHTIRRAIERGDAEALSFALGLSDNSIDATGYDRLIDACKPAAHQILIKGAKGSGKTTKAIDITRKMYQDGYIDKVMTNIEGPQDHQDVEFAENISDFLEFAKRDGEKLAIFDEFSTSGNAYVGQQNVEQIMSRVINAFRKSSGGSLRTMYIGHENNNDIHPLVKKQSDVVIQADGKKDEGLIDKVTVYRGWSDFTDDDTWFRVRGLQDVSQSSDWSFDTNYFAVLEWNLDAPGEQIKRGQLIDNWRQYQDGSDSDDDESDSDDDESEYDSIKCRGYKEDNSPCQTVTPHKSGYCKWHRDQWNDDKIDPRHQ